MGRYYVQLATIRALKKLRSDNQINSRIRRIVTIWSPGKNKGISQIANPLKFFGVPKGIRTPVADVKAW